MQRAGHRVGIVGLLLSAGADANAAQNRRKGQPAAISRQRFHHQPRME